MTLAHDKPANEAAEGDGDDEEGAADGSAQVSDLSAAIGKVRIDGSLCDSALSLLHSMTAEGDRDEEEEGAADGSASIRADGRLWQGELSGRCVWVNLSRPCKAVGLASKLHITGLLTGQMLKPHLVQVNVKEGEGGHSGAADAAKLADAPIPESAATNGKS